MQTILLCLFVFWFLCFGLNDDSEEYFSWRLIFVSNDKFVGIMNLRYFKKSQIFELPSLLMIVQNINYQFTIN